MQKAKIPYDKQAYEAQIRTFRGLNRTEGAGDGECIDMTNMTMQDYPAIRTRDARTKIGEWEDAEDLFEVDGHMAVVAGGKLYWDGAEATTVQAGAKQWAMVNGKLVIWPDKLELRPETGAVRSIPAELSGTGTIADGALTIAGAGKSSTWPYQSLLKYGGGMAYAEEDPALWTMGFENLRVENGRLKYDSAEWVRLAYGSEYPSDGMSPPPVGFQFVGSQIVYIVSDYGTYPPSDMYQISGTTYSTITDRWQETDGTWKVTISTVRGGSGAGAAQSLFEDGDPVTIEGSTLLVNNREGARIESVSNNTLRFADGTFVETAYYYNVTGAISPGILALTVASTSQIQPSVTIYAESLKTIPAGAQIYVTYSGSAITSKDSVTGIYVYDPEMKTSTQLEQKSYTSNNTPETVATCALTKWTATTAQAMTVRRETPEMAYICAHGNRLYGVANAVENRIFNQQTGSYETVMSRVLYASELGYPTRWYSYNGWNTDAYAVAIGGKGDFTGICEYSGAVLAFKEDRMYRLTGEYPAEYYLRDYSVDGVRAGAHKSLQVINESLYYLAPQGVMRYAGGVPSLESYQLGLQPLQAGAAGRDRYCYYLSVQDAAGWHLVKYDTVHGLWTREDAVQMTGACRVGDALQFCAGGEIWQTGGGTETISWSMTLPEWDEDSFAHKRYRKLLLLAEIESGSIRVETRKNDEDWTEDAVLNVTGERVHRVVLDERRCDRLQLRLSGTGAATLRAISRQVAFESED